MGEIAMDIAGECIPEGERLRRGDDGRLYRASIDDVLAGRCCGIARLAAARLGAVSIDNRFSPEVMASGIARTIEDPETGEVVTFGPDGWIRSRSMTGRRRV